MALLTTKQVNLIDQKEFAKATLDQNSKIFVVYVTFLSLSSNSIYLNKKAQKTFLIAKKVKIPKKYSDFANVFLEEKTMVLSDQTKLNEHAIKIENSKQPAYRPIYSLEPVKLETLKMYIKTLLKTGFIWLFKSPASAFISFDKKPDGSFYLYIDY